MRTFQLVGPIRAYLRGVRAEGKSVAFVPTMGALHEGHASLFRRARTDCDIVVASIFVNPAQFGPGEDLAAYPRDLNRDQQIASNEGIDALFHPDISEMYPTGFQTVVDVPELGSVLEGEHRPGHFRGVATVVAKLLNIARADRAYFGQKDYQQLLIVERLARDLNVPTDIIAVPTARASDGLALSSRNAYLNEAERADAVSLYKAIGAAEQYVEEGGVDVPTLSSELNSLFAAVPSASVDYIALVDPITLRPVETLAGQTTLLALAVRIGATRLIDNTLLAPKGVARPRHWNGRTG